MALCMSEPQISGKGARMETKPLGHAGVRVSAVGLGTWRDRASVPVIQRALDVGATLIDTAESYGNEDDVGRAIRGRREEAFVATKVSARNHRRADLLAAAERSLRALDIETIDLYQLHAPSSTVPFEETFAAMDELVRAGKVRHLGVSNFDARELAEAERILGEGRIVENQIKYSLFDHEFADTVIPFCVERGIAVMAYSTLEQGLLAERLRERPALGPVLDGVCAETGCTRAQVLLNWALCCEPVVVIPATSRPERVNENAGAAGWRLSPEQYGALTEAAGPGRSTYWWR